MYLPLWAIILIVVVAAWSVQAYVHSLKEKVKDLEVEVEDLKNKLQVEEESAAEIAEEIPADDQTSEDRKV